MIDFSQIEKHSLFYDLVKSIFRFQHNHLYYRKVYVENKSKLPALGEKMIIVCNHQNGLMDALAILHGIPFSYHSLFLARADIFKKDTLAKILRWLRIMPIYRPRDGKENMGENDAIFKKCISVCNQAYPVILFPEGTHQHGRYLGQIKKGFARMAFDTAKESAFADEIKIMPIGVHYQDYRGYGKKLLLQYGEAVCLSEYYALYQENPAAALRELSVRIEESLNSLMLNFREKELYDLFDPLREIARRPMANRLGLSLRKFKDVYKVDKALCDVLYKGKSKVSENEEFRSRVQNYTNSLKKWRIEDRHFCSKHPFLKAFLLLFLALLELPFALPAILVFGPIDAVLRKVCSGLSKKIKDQVLPRSFYFVLSHILLFPLLTLCFLAASALIFKNFLWTFGFYVVLIVSKLVYYHLGDTLKNILSYFRAGRLGFHEKEVKGLKTEDRNFILSALLSHLEPLH